jgi:hypothetical protein
MMEEPGEKEKFPGEDIRYMKVAISLALASSDMLEMPKEELYLTNFMTKSNECREVRTKYSAAVLISWDKDYEI